MEAPHKGEVGLKRGDGLLQRGVVVCLELLEVAVTGDGRMAEGVVEEQTSVDFTVALLPVQTVVGGDDQEVVTAQRKRLRHGLAAQIVGARVMRRKEVGQDDNSHGASG